MGRDLTLTFQLEAERGSRWNRSLGEDPQGLAGDAGDLELTFLLEAGWGRRMEQESG